MIACSLFTKKVNIFIDRFWQSQQRNRVVRRKLKAIKQWSLYVISSPNVTSMPFEEGTEPLQSIKGETDQFSEQVIFIVVIKLTVSFDAYHKISKITLNSSVKLLN